MWSKKIFLVWLTVLLGLFSAVCGGLFILFLTAVLWQISGYAVGALLGVLSVLFFVMARAALRGASQSSKKELNWATELERLQEARQLMRMPAQQVDRRSNKK